MKSHCPFAEKKRSFMLSLGDKILWLIFSFSTLTVLAGVPAKNYTVRDGLVNNTVRCFYEHPNGELWIGTDGGISIYNGHSFRSLTVKDGLVGNFVWSLIGDTHGGIWFACYDNGLTYLKNGKFYNYGITDGLQNVRIRTIYFEDDYLFIGTENGLFQFDYRTKMFSQIENPIQNSEHFQVMQFLKVKNDLLVVTRKSGVYRLLKLPQKKPKLEKMGQGISLHKVVSIDNTILYCSAEGVYKQPKLFSENEVKLNENVVWDYSYSLDSNEVYIASWNVTEAGGGLLKYANGQLSVFGKSLAIDSKNIWAVKFLSTQQLAVGSLDKGIYLIDMQLNNVQRKNMLNIKGRFEFIGNSYYYNDLSIYSQYGDKLFELSDENIRKWKYNPKMIRTHLSDEFMLNKIHKSNHFINSVVTIDTNIFISTSFGLIEVSGNWKTQAIYPIQTDVFHIAKSTLIYQRPFHDFFIVKNFPKGVDERIKKTVDEQTPSDILHYQCNGDSVIIWTKVKGFFVFAEGKTPYRIMDNSQFGHLKSVSSYQNKALLVNSNDELFSATFSAKGCAIKKIEVPFSYNSIFKVELHDKYRVIHFDEGVYVSDGQQERILNTANILPDAEIRTVFLSKNSLAISLPEYIIQVPLAFLFKYEIILPKINFVTSLKKIPFDQNSHVISVNKIAVQHPNNYLYYYQVNEQDTIPLAGNEIYLMNLSSGEYSVKVLTYSYLTNTWQTQANYLFSKDKAPWEKLYFWILGLTLIGTFVTIWVYKKKLHSNKRKLEKQAIEKEVLNQKLLAIQAKMNPHFMFNALNSIQNYIIDSDTDNALMYLSEFAKLMRQTVDYSSMSQITLSEEIAFLERYVRIEQMRFTSKIVLEKEIDATALGLTIPPMILQPLVENAFIHGLDTNSTDIQTIRLTIKELSPTKQGISVSNPKTNEVVFYPKHNSFGIKSIEQRLKLVNPENRLTVHDLDNQFRIDLELFVNV